MADVHFSPTFQLLAHLQSRSRAREAHRTVRSAVPDTASDNVDVGASRDTFVDVDAPLFDASVVGDVTSTIAELTKLASVAVDRAGAAKTALRGEIQSLVSVNQKTLYAMNAELTKTKKVLWRYDNNMSARMSINLNAALGGESINTIQKNYDRGVEKRDRLQQRLTAWRASIPNVEAQVADLEKDAVRLSQFQAPSENVAVLRAQVDAVGGLQSLQANLQKQIDLLTGVRDAGARLSVAMSKHLRVLVDLRDRADAMMADATALFAQLIDAFLTADPAVAVRAIVEDSLQARIQSTLDDAGLTPTSFADNLLQGQHPEVGKRLRPQLEHLFATQMPAGVVAAGAGNVDFS